MSPFDPVAFQRVARDVLLSDDVRILLTLAAHASQKPENFIAPTAHTLGLTEGRVRHRFFRSIDRMEQAGGDLAPFVAFFKKISSPT